TATAGSAFNVTVVARDAFNNVAAYAGPAHFTSSDPAATLPADGTLNGSATLRTVNAQTITATDGAITGSASIDVSAAAATSFSIDPIANQTAGVAFPIHAVAHDAFGNVATSFSGTATLATNDGPISPVTLAFSAGIADANVTLTRAGTSRTITATQASINGTSNAFDVAAGPLDHFRIEAATGGAIGAQTTGVPFAIRITALDAFGNVVPSFTGTATITSTGSLMNGGTTAPFIAGLLATHSLTLDGNGPITITVTAGQVSTTSAPFAVGALADLSLQLSGSLFAEAGGNVDYTLIVRNAGPSTAHAPIVTLTLPSGWPLASSSAPCASGFPCTLPDLAPHASTTITVTANTPLGADGAYPISATVSSTSPDNAPANNQASISTTVSTTAAPCPPAPTLLPAAIAEVSSGATYHVSWGDAGVANYEWQEATDASFTGAIATMTNATSVAFRHDVNTATAFFYRVRPIIPCLGVLPFSNAVRVVVQPRTSDGTSVELMVETGSTDKLTQTVHVDAPRGATSVTPFAFVARSDQPWLDVSPVSGGIPPTGIDLTLTISASARPIGTSVANATLLSDGVALAGLRVNLHVAPPMTVEPRTAPVPANASLIPGVAHAPSAGVLWQSDVRLLNASSKTTKYGLSFTPSGESGATSGRRVELDIPAGAAVAFDDVVRHFFGYGALAGESAIGALDIRPSDPNARTVVTSRTYAVTPNGTYGQSIPAMSAPSFAGPGATLSLQHLAQSTAFRTNVGLAEVSGQPATVRLRVLDDAGRELARTDLTLAAFEQRQYNSLLADLGVIANDARIEIAVTSTTGRIAAYASVVDNITADPTLIPGAPPAAIHATRYIVPGVADFDTGRNNWRSDLRIFNASQASATLTVSFLPQGGGTPIARSVTIAPGEVKAYDSILRTLFDVTGNGGAVHITSASDATLVVTARTYDATANGTYGQFIPAVTAPEATALGERPLEILHIEQTNAYRANIGFVEVTGQPAKVEVVATL
ncbi:MAG: DUF11 domain-containing protein, partial [Acidobacteria bacterium]|nr:DUF11 domain-containing protein [Acidobacteriota bacterium]